MEALHTSLLQPPKLNYLPPPLQQRVRKKWLTPMSVFKLYSIMAKKLALPWHHFPCYQEITHPV